MLGASWNEEASKDGQWEKVTAKAKPKKGDAPKNLTKAELKKEQAKAPDAKNAKLLASVRRDALFEENETDSAFAVLDAWERKKEERAAGQSRGREENGDDDFAFLREAKAGKKMPKQPKVKKVKVTVKDAAAGVDSETVATVLEEVDRAYPDRPDYQVMRCADYFLGVFKACDLPFQKTLMDGPLSKAVDVPLCWLPEEIVESTCDWLVAKPRDRSLQKVVMDILDACLEGIEAPKGYKGKAPAQINPPKAKIGLLMVVAMIVRAAPEAIVNNAKALAAPKYSNSYRMPYLMWLYGQAAKSSAGAGVALWVRNMLPLVLGVGKAPSAMRNVYMEFIEGLVTSKTMGALVSDASKGGFEGFSLVSPTVLDSVARAAHGRVDACSEGDRTRLGMLYPALRRLALAGGGKLGNVARGILPLALEGAGLGNKPLADACYANAVWCLQSDLTCFAQWESIHAKQLKGSAECLARLADACSSPGKAPPGLQKDALQALCRGVERASKGVQGNAQAEKAAAACRRIAGTKAGGRPAGKGLIGKLFKLAIFALIVGMLTGYISTDAAKAGVEHGFRVVLPPQRASAAANKVFQFCGLFAKTTEVMWRPLTEGWEMNAKPMFQEMWRDTEPAITKAWLAATSNIRPGLTLLYKEFEVEWDKYEPAVKAYMVEAQAGINYTIARCAAGLEAAINYMDVGLKALTVA